MSQRSLKPFIKTFALTYIVLGSVCFGTATAQETMSFPARSSDLPANSYWTVTEFSEGRFIIDFNVSQWTGSSWKGQDGSLSNSQDYTWDVPLYAPISGKIASCWRNFPDNPNPPQKMSSVDNSVNNQVGNDIKIFGGGNHVVIVTPQGNLVSMSHFKSGSIRPDLCPPNKGFTVYPPSVTKQGNWRVDSYIPPGSRPSIKEGEYIGRAGNSGNSSGPHLHIQYNVVNGTDANGREAIAPGSAMKFRHVWAHPYNRTTALSPGKWYRMRGNNFVGNADCPTYQANAPQCFFTIVHPAPYLRRASASAGGVRDTETLFLSSNRAVTAVRDSDGNLKLVAWDLNGVTSISRKGATGAGAIKEVKLSEPKDNYILAAVRTGDGVLKMIAYGVTPSGNFLRVADKTLGKIALLDVATIGGGDKKTVTAMRDQAGNLKIIVWDINVAANGNVSVVRLGDASAGLISALAVSRARNFNGVFTAVRDSQGNLKVIPWKISSNGQTITRGSSGTAGAVGGAIDVAPLAQGVAVAAPDAQNKLRLITWSTNAAGNVGTRRDTATAGGATEIQLLNAPLGQSNLTVVARGADGVLRILGWTVNDTGTNLRRVGSVKAGTASNISADMVARSYPGLDPRDMLLTAVKDKTGKLKLMAWDTNLVNP